MQSGILTSANVSDIFRGLSQKRRQGLMEFNLAEVSVKILFIQGKIVDMFDSEKSGARELDAHLVTAGMIHASLEPGQEVSYTEYFERLAASELLETEMTSDRFRQAVKHRVLERLYSLELGGGAYYSFKVQMVDGDRDFAPSISVGQILLDLVELLPERDEYQGVFPTGSTVRIVGDISDDLSEEEHAILGELESPRAVDVLQARSLLSSFHFRHALLDLHRRGLVLPTSAQARASSATFAAGLGEELFASLDGAIDAAFDAEFGLEGAAAVENDAAEESNDDTIVDAEDFGDERVRGSSLHVMSAKLLQAEWVPNLILVLFILSAALVPMLMWHRPGGN